MHIYASNIKLGKPQLNDELYELWIGIFECFNSWSCAYHTIYVYYKWLRVLRITQPFVHIIAERHIHTNDGFPWQMASYAPKSFMVFQKRLIHKVEDTYVMAIVICLIITVQSTSI